MEAMLDYFLRRFGSRRMINDHAKRRLCRLAPHAPQTRTYIDGIGRLLGT
jgi:hypothetical protein